MAKIKLIKYSRIIAVVLLLIFLYNLKLIAPVESFLMGLVNPILSRVYSASNKLNVSYNREFNNRDLRKENTDLKSENDRLIVSNSKMAALESENQTLRAHLKFLKQDNFKYVLANVISISDLNNEIQTITIDKGSKNGLQDNLIVVNEQGIAVGKIVEVKDNISFVQLTTSSKCKLAATVQNKAKTSGITHGEMGLTINMDFIPLPEAIKKGDIVITSGLEKNIPRGIVIGKVSEVFKANNELWQNAVIESMIKSNEMVVVSAIIP
jgi:rod shape-determining protein MreC